MLPFLLCSSASTPIELGPMGFRPGLANAWNKGLGFLLISLTPNTRKFSLPTKLDRAQSGGPDIKGKTTSGWFNLSFLDFQVLGI